jgi:exo-beta-1,3-glucanase (GH17 family)
MKLRLTGSLIYIALLAFLLSSCASNKHVEAQEFSASRVKCILEKERQIERQNPFTERQFVPYLDGKWIGQAASYGCYRNNQAPGTVGPSKAEILEDLNIIKQHWNMIRVYNADDDTQNILEVIDENNFPIKVVLGIWLGTEESSPETKQSNIANVLRGIELCNQYPDIVNAVIVGNETQVFWTGHRLKIDSLVRYIRIVRKHTTVPVSTADDYNYWNKPESKVLASEVDFIVTHAYPLWNGKNLDNAIDWLDETYTEVAKIHPTKLQILGEIGWATSYNAEKQGDGEQGSLIKGEVGVDAQGDFLIALDAWICKTQAVTFLFEVFDEPWKGGGMASGINEIEKNWGVFYTDRSPKKSFVDYLVKKETSRLILNH